MKARGNHENFFSQNLSKCFPPHFTALDSTATKFWPAQPISIMTVRFNFDALSNTLLLMFLDIKFRHLSALNQELKLKSPLLMHKMKSGHYVTCSH